MRTIQYSGTRGNWRGMVVLVAALAVGLVGVLLAQGQAQAHDHQIPQTVLKKGTNDLQTGLLVKESRWDRLVGEDLCENELTFYRTRFPETDSVAAGANLRVRIFKAQRPDSFFVAAYREVDENGEPAGEAQMLKRTLGRVVRDGKTVAWDAVFSVNRPSRDYYLISGGLWHDTEGCDADQFAYWSFHVKTRA